MAVTYSNRMNAADALLWNNERDPMLRSTITSVMILDQPPAELGFREAVHRTLARVPRLQQRVVLDPLRAAPPRWERDPNFDLTFHVRRIRSAGKGTLRDLLDLAAPIAMHAFDKDRPLWELHVVEGLEEGRAALILKLHHSVSDGVGMVRMTSSLVERSRVPTPRRSKSTASVLEEPGAGSAFEEALRALRYRAEANMDLASRVVSSIPRGLGRLLRDPAGAVDSARRMAGSLGRLLQPVSEPLSPVMVGRSASVRFDALAVPLEDLKRSAKAAQGTLNDAFVSAVAGGLRLYHQHHGKPVRELRMTMPINLREGKKGEEAGNQFAPARFAVPVGTRDPVERMREIHALVIAQREEPALPMAEEISGVLVRLPRSFSVRLSGSMLKAIDFVTSNVPGPPFTVYSSGAKVEQMVGFGPLSGAAANVTLFSYDGTIQMGINTDPAAVQDPDVFVACIEKGLAEILSVS